MGDLEQVHLKVNEVFYPSEELKKECLVQDYESMYQKSIENPDEFWSEVASELFWYQKWDRVLEWNFPYAKWFVNGKTNITYNCLDRHVENGRRNKLAFISVDEEGNEKKLTYGELLESVSKLANGLKSLGLSKGDRVSIYLPNTVEAVIAMLACARIGVIHSVVF
uniref:acetyl-coenzyme A synthetase N-terminal domain-containing protein n=1 Tax=Sulfurihydrogenibium sp. TaxID=2053621 RepID=UPI00260F938A